MKVALCVLFGHRQGGAEAMLLHSLRANTASPRLEVVVFFLVDGPLLQTVRALGYNVEVFNAGRLRDPVRSIATLRRLRSAFRRAHVDAVLAWTTKVHRYLSVGIFSPQVMPLSESGNASHYPWDAPCYLATSDPQRAMQRLQRRGWNVLGKAKKLVTA